MYLRLAVAVLLAVSGLFALTRQLHMLQQNSYFNTRYLDWLRTAFRGATVWSFVCIAAIVWLSFIDLYIFSLQLAILILAVRVRSARSQQNKAIKPLVFTARVKRMYATAAVIFGLLCAAVAVFNSIVLVAVVGLLSFATPLMCVAANVINAPLEAAIRQYYIGDAGRILRGFGDRLTIIGVTGSYGKTSTKYILSRILSEKYNVVITPGSFNTTLGVVRTVREQLRPSADVFIVEMGAKQVGDIDEICRLVKPTMGVISSVGPQHLNTFGSIENVLKTKFELADSVHSRGGKMFLCGDNEYIGRRITDDDTLYGCGEGNDYHAENIVCSRFGTQFDAVLPDGERLQLHTKLLGRHSVANILAAVAVAEAMGVSRKDIVYAVSQLQSVEHRLQLKPFLNGSTLIDDAYNSNPEGCLEAVRTLGTFEDMKKIVVTPGLVELGEREYDCNKALGAECAAVCDHLVFVGEQRSVPLVDGAKSAGCSDDKIHVVPTFKDAMALLATITDGSTAVLFENDLPDNYAK